MCDLKYVYKYTYIKVYLYIIYNMFILHTKSCPEKIKTDL